MYLPKLLTEIADGSGRGERALHGTVRWSGDKLQIDYWNTQLLHLSNIKYLNRSITSTIYIQKRLWCIGWLIVGARFLIPFAVVEFKFTIVGSAEVECAPTEYSHRSCLLVSAC